jgi:hypothetical protein
MEDVQVAMLHYYPDTHLTTKGTFYLPKRPRGRAVHGAGRRLRRAQGGSEIDLPARVDAPVSVLYVKPSGTQGLYRVDLATAPDAIKIAESKAYFDKRAAAFVLYSACHRLLPWTVYRTGTDCTGIALAKLEYFDCYQPDFLPGENCQKS